MKLIINERFRDLCPPLTREEFEQLEDNVMKAKRIKEPIDTWKDQILDGHHRYKIHQKHGYKIDVVTHVFRDEDEACQWIIRNQLGRRNLTPEQASYLRGSLYNTVKDDHGGARRNSSGQNDHLKKTSEKTAISVAKSTGVSEKTVRRDAEYAEHLAALPGPIKDEILSGKLKASKKEVAALSELKPGEQKYFAGKVRSGEAKSFTEAFKEDEPPRDPKEEAAEKLNGLAKTIEQVRVHIDTVVGLVGKHRLTDQIMTKLDESLMAMKKWATTLQ